MPEQHPRWAPAEWGMLLYAPFDRAFAKAMKDMVPRDEREWRAKEEAWWISDAWVDHVDVLATEHFEDYIGT